MQQCHATSKPTAKNKIRQNSPEPFQPLPACMSSAQHVLHQCSLHSCVFWQDTLIGSFGVCLNICFTISNAFPLWLRAYVKNIKKLICRGLQTHKNAIKVSSVSVLMKACVRVSQDCGHIFSVNVYARKTRRASVGLLDFIHRFASSPQTPAVLLLIFVFVHQLGLWHCSSVFKKKVCLIFGGDVHFHFSFFFCWELAETLSCLYANHDTIG